MLAAIHQGIDLTCHVAVCGVDNNSARLAATRYFSKRGVPVIFTAVSADTDHGYILIQKADGPCVGCLFPCVDEDESFPCPGTPQEARMPYLTARMQARRDLKSKH